MADEEFQYQLECDVCGVDTFVVVSEVDEKPLFCTMCGSEAANITEHHKET
jgi:rRNA maturation endonuclease Nob1